VRAAIASARAREAVVAVTFNAERRRASCDVCTTNCKGDGPLGPNSLYTEGGEPTLEPYAKKRPRTDR